MRRRDFVALFGSAAALDGSDLAKAPEKASRDVIAANNEICLGSLAAVSVARARWASPPESGHARRQASYGAFSSSLRGGLAARFTCNQDSARKSVLARRQALASRPRTDDRGHLERPSPLPCICD